MFKKKKRLLGTVLDCKFQAKWKMVTVAASNLYEGKQRPPLKVPAGLDCQVGLGFDTDHLLKIY